MEIIEIPQSLRDLIRAARRQTAQMSQRKAAKLAGITGTWWRHIETGQAPRASVEVVAAMCSVARVPPASLDLIGLNDLAQNVTRRNLLLQDSKAYTEEAEKYIWEAPGQYISAPEKRSLIAHLRMLRSVAHDDTVAQQIVTELRDGKNKGG